MRRFVWIFALSGAMALLVLPRGVRCQQQDQSKSPEQPMPSPQKAPQPPTANPADQPQPETLGEAARKAREQRKESAKPARVFDNDNMPSQGVISTVGTATEGAAGEGTGTAPKGAAAKGSAAKGSAPPSKAAGAGTPVDENGWRERFGRLRDTLARDEQELEVMQRELSVLDVVNYPDPQKALQQETTRSDINKKTADIEKKKKKIEADRQAIADAEDELRKSGGDIGWSR